MFAPAICSAFGADVFDGESVGLAPSDFELSEVVATLLESGVGELSLAAPGFAASVAASLPLG